MSRRSKRNRIVGLFVALEHHVIDAFEEKKMSFSARWTYILLKKKFNPVRNDNRVILTYSEVQNVMSRTTFARALRELEKAGFIEKIHHGGLALGRNLEKSANIYKLTNNYKRWGKNTP